MMNLSFSGSAVGFPSLRWLHTARAWRVAADEHFRAHATSIVPIAGLLIVAASVPIIVSNMHVRFPGTSTPKGQASSLVASQKMAKQSEHVGGACQGAQASSHLFASCPSFLVDYSSQKNGTVNPDIFTVYTGAPEANNEAQLYTGSAQNLRVQDGSLLLEALNNPQQGFNYTSARISTQGKKSFLYGKLVVRAELPGGIGTWPAIWMLPSNSTYEDLSPASNPNRYLNGGEIDIAESVGTQPNAVYGIAHSLAYPEDGADRSYYNVVTVPGNNLTFHDYEVDWTPTSLTFRVDGEAFFTYTKQSGADYRSWPFDQPFYLVLNLALGGNWAGTDTAQFPGDGVDKSMLPATMKVQSIGYYAYTGDK